MCIILETNDSMEASSVDSPWRKLLNYQRLLCYFSAKHIRENYIHGFLAVSVSIISLQLHVKYYLRVM